MITAVFVKRMRFNPIDPGSESDVRSALFDGKKLDLFQQLFSDSMTPVLRQHTDAVHFDITSRMTDRQHFYRGGQSDDFSIRLCNKRNIAAIMAHCFICFGHVFIRRIPDAENFPPNDSHSLIIALTYPPDH